MDLEKRPEQPMQQSPEGCLAVAIRVPVRIVVLVLVVPVRMVWDACVVAGRFLRDTVLRPLGRALGWLARAVFVWPLVGLWRHVVVPLGRAIGWLGKVLVVIPLGWLYLYVLTPFGRALVTVLTWFYARVLTPVGQAVMWVFRGIGVVLVAVFMPIGRVLVRCAQGVAWAVGMLVTGVGIGLYWVTRVLFVLPALALWRWVLVPVGRVLAVVGREVWDALGHAWRVAGRISLAVGRALATLFRWIFVEPVRWVYRTVLTPVGHVVRDFVLRPVASVARSVGRATREALATARESVRQARADFRRMLFGEPARVESVDRREPVGRETRTLDSSTTALTKE